MPEPTPTPPMATHCPACKVPLAGIMAAHVAQPPMWPGDIVYCRSCRWNSSGGSPWPCEPYRLAAALAAAQEREQRVAEFRIVGTWLVEEVGHHTCGTERGGHFGAHEPGCGQEPVVNLATVPGFAALAGEGAADQPQRSEQ